MKIIALALFVSTASLARASSCGESAIAFSFEALEDGRPVLGCARPSCSGWSADPSSSSSAQFYRINGVPDGFMRKNAEASPRRNGDYQPQAAHCDGFFEKSSCGLEGQWVGGIGPVSNTSTQQLSLQCCSHESLRYATDRGVAVVKSGQIVIGGEVTKKGRQYAFDYISNIALRRGPDGSISYDVSIRRFPCVPAYNEQPAGVESEVHSDIMKKFDGVPASNHVAFQAPIRAGGEGPLQQIGVQETIERVVETPVRQQQLPQQQLPENYRVVEEVQQIQQPVQPQFQQPVQQPYQQVVYQPQPQPQQYYYQPQPVQPAPQYYQPAPAAPAAAPGGYYGGFGAGAGACFAADTLVHTSQGKDVRMDELKVDDWVLAKDGAKVTYLPVKSWLHRLPELEAKFHKLELEDGTTLKLTRKHYIYTTNCDKLGERANMGQLNDKAVHAEEVQEGDCVYQIKGEQNKEYMVKARVVSNTVVKDTGIFAPLTSSGDIVVNGIHASCHTILHSNALQSTFFEYADYFRSLGSYLFGAEDNEVKDVPMGTEIWASLAELVLPKDLHTL